MSNDGTEQQSPLRVTTLGALLDSCTLPSGATYVLQPDTVEIGLKVAEASDPLKWREKALQVVTVTESINGQNIKAAGGVEFVNSLLDTDVMFLAMAWTFEVNGRELKFDKAVPCPQCTAPFSKVDMNELGIAVRDTPVSGLHAIVPIELPAELIARLPASIKDGVLHIKDPTWREARSRVPANNQADMEVIDVHRALSALLVKHGDKAPRAVTRAEANQFPMRVIQSIIAEMDRLVPNFTRELKFKCKSCEVEIDIPFDRAGA